MLPGCHSATADPAGDGTTTAAATGAPTAAGPKPPALIALAVGRTTPAATRAAKPAPARDTAADGREPDTPTDATGVRWATRLAAAREDRRATSLLAVADAPRPTDPGLDESAAVLSAWATPDPPANAAPTPTPRPSTPAPSQEYGVRGRRRAGLE